MDRGQVHTLEGVIAALLLVTSVVFALQMTAVTPLSASTSSQHIENQLQTSAQGVLAGAAAADELEPAILAWNHNQSRFHGTTSERFYVQKTPPNAFGDRLERAFGDRGIAYNVYLRYGVGGGLQETRYVYRGAPSTNAVRASRTLLLTDTDTLYNQSMAPTNHTLNGTELYVPNVDQASPTYNVIRVEVVVWRI